MINVAFTPTELKLIAHVVDMAAEEFSNHGCNEVDVTKLGLTSADADEIRSAMAKANVIDNEQAVDCQGNKYLHDTTLLHFLHMKLKEMMGLSVEEAEQRIVAPLLAVGLVAKVSKTEPLIIVGGRGSEVSDGLVVYIEGFRIWEDPDTRLYYAGKSKDSDHGWRGPHRSPENAVQWIIDLYSGNLPPKVQSNRPRGRRSY